MSVQNCRPVAVHWALVKWRRLVRGRLALLMGAPSWSATDAELQSERKVLRARLREIDAELASRQIMRVSRLHS